MPRPGRGVEHQQPLVELGGDLSLVAEDADVPHMRATFLFTIKVTAVDDT